MLRKIMKQVKVPWIGEFKETLSQALWWGTVINSIMLAGTFYYTTLRFVWPWFDLTKFIAVVAVGIVVIYIVEYKWIIPSIWAFRSKQMFEHESKITDKIDALGKKLDELNGRISQK